MNAFALRKHLIRLGFSKLEADAMLYYVEKKWVEFKLDDEGNLLMRLSDIGVLALWDVNNNFYGTQTVH